MAFVAPEPSYLWWGLLMLGIGTFAYELAQVEYNAMIYRLAPPGRTGRVSGIGWAAGYVGGIVLLLLCFVLFLSDSPVIAFEGEGTAVRVVVVLAAIWFALATIPVLRMRFPFPAPPGDTEAAVGWAASYRLLFRRLARLTATTATCWASSSPARSTATASPRSSPSAACWRRGPSG